MVPSISTHSLTRRLTPFDIKRKLTEKDFNSQPHKEADMLIADFTKRGEDFNSQPHKEADEKGGTKKFRK